MKTSLHPLLLISLITTTFNAYPQIDYYWKDAPLGSVKIYSLFFTSDQIGYALSLNAELFISNNSGTSWRLSLISTDNVSPEDSVYLWLAEIYCSAMKTSDGGKNWEPYPSSLQEHFCRVFFKDPNVNYEAASEFLKSVSTEIFGAFKQNSWSSLIDKPIQCTEYYSNEKEGWAVGWCLRQLKKGRMKAGFE